MDQILRMIMNQLTRKLVNKGVNAGLNKASSLGRKPAPKQTAQMEGGATPDPSAGGLTKQQVREQRRAKRAANQAG